MVHRQTAVCPIYLEFATMIEEIERVVVTRVGQAKSEGRTRRIVSLVVLPDGRRGQ
ncbi:hypothetical protein AB0H88_37465 [Nonomuraea sp. NPDC050680]|uniref:hypothetical protein n=1 Tax=Nonomuraea sp. NPDC050680 TaxID=3154630 RepID=UPI0033C5BF35